MSFSEYICNLILRGNKNEIHCIMMNMMTYELAIDFNVLCVFMKDIIMGNLHFTLIITIKKLQMKMEYLCSKVTNEAIKAQSSISQSVMFSISTRVRYNGLLLTTPRDERIT